MGAISFAFLAKSAGIFLTEKTDLWDVVPGTLLIEELGGKVFNFQRENWQITDNSLLAILSLNKDKEKKLWEILELDQA